MLTASALERNCFLFATAGLFAGAMLHVVVLIGGPDWIAFVGAPKAVVESARNGTWLAPVGAIAIAALLAGLGNLSFRAASRKNSFPKLRFLLWGFSIIFLVRGLIALPVLFSGRIRWTDPIHLFFVAGSIFVFAIGLALIVGLWLQRSEAEQNGGNPGPIGSTI